MTTNMKISHDLMEAYKGSYEQEDFGDITTEAWETLLREKIAKHTPKQRLAVYLNWNGILGWTDRIWSITQGEL